MEIVIANLKCSGCSASITNALIKIKGVKSVNVILDADTVKLETDTQVSRNEVVQTLLKLGYPEATAENGLLLKLKSYTSCMIGKLKS